MNKKIIGVVSVIGITLFGCVLYAQKDKLLKPTDYKITQIQKVQLDKKMEDKSSFLLVHGDKTDDKTILLKKIIKESNVKIKYDILFFDTNYYTSILKKDNATAKEIQDGVNDMTRYLSTYKVKSLPSISFVSKGEVKQNSGKFINDKFSQTPTKKEKKQFKKESTTLINKWLKQIDKKTS
ncbi:MAG: hypothetical protein RSC93_04210 [Erysipelotrichaceae bacterium]